MKKQGIIWLMVFAFLPTCDICAQLSEYGLNAGVIGSRYTVGDNRPDENIIVKQGSIYPAATIGISALMGAPKDQPVNHIKLYSSMLLELNYCYCGGNVDLLTPKKSRYELNMQKYIIQNLNFNALYYGRLRKFIFVLGPSIAYNFNRKVFLKRGRVKASAYKINEFFVGAEFGIGFRINNLILSSRYNINLTDFSKNTPLIDTRYNSHQLKFVVSYFLFEKHIGKYWGSIYGK